MAGVVRAVSGYTGGTKENPTYKEVSAGKTGHVEAVQVYYDPAKVTYEELLDYFWRHVDPTDSGGQFVDRGSQYRSVIFYQDEEQKRLAEESKENLAKSAKFDKPIATEIIRFTKFYEAEEYHQDYYTYRLDIAATILSKVIPSPIRSFDDNPITSPLIASTPATG
jgi:peptide methionine sulfoxide reductase msrA/msrB